MNARIDRYTELGAEETVKYYTVKMRKLNAILRDEEIGPRLTTSMWLILDDMCGEYLSKLDAAKKYLDEHKNKSPLAK